MNNVKAGDYVVCIKDSDDGSFTGKPGETFKVLDVIDDGPEYQGLVLKPGDVPVDPARFRLLPWQHVNITEPIDLTIRELQTNLPWTIRYSNDFRSNPQSHKDFSHAVLHTQKALGNLAALADDMDHDRTLADSPGIKEYHRYIADLVVCALRMANTFPGGVCDLQRAVEDRIESKNNTKLVKKG